MIRSDTFSLIKPFMATVNASGQASLSITHSLQGMLWQIFQIGFALNQASPSPQVAAHLNGIPLVASVTMQAVAFTGFPYAMETFFVGPPYVGLRAGDQIVCSVIGAQSGDIFTAGAYLSEEQEATQQNVPFWYE